MAKHNILSVGLILAVRSGELAVRIEIVVGIRPRGTDTVARLQNEESAQQPQNCYRRLKTGHPDSNSVYLSKEAVYHLRTVRGRTHEDKQLTEHATPGRSGSCTVISFVGWIFLHSIDYIQKGTEDSANERKRSKIHTIN